MLLDQGSTRVEEKRWRDRDGDASCSWPLSGRRADAVIVESGRVTAVLKDAEQLEGVLVLAVAIENTELALGLLYSRFGAKVARG